MVITSYLSIQTWEWYHCPHNYWQESNSVYIPKCQTILLSVCMYTSRCVSLCASRLWICLVMELNTSCKSTPSASTSSSHRSGSITRGSWVICGKDSLSGLYDKISVHLGNLTQSGRSGDKQSRQCDVWIQSRDATVNIRGKEISHSLQ